VCEGQFKKLADGRAGGYFFRMVGIKQIKASTIFLVVVGSLFPIHTIASETAAIVPYGFLGVGAVNGPVGFSFTPTVSIAVNNVSYLQAGANATPSISFWSGSNNLATYDFPPGAAVAEWISYTNTLLRELPARSVSRWTISPVFGNRQLQRLGARPDLDELLSWPQFRVSGRSAAKRCPSRIKCIPLLARICCFFLTQADAQFNPGELDRRYQSHQHYERR